MTKRGVKILKGLGATFLGVGLLILYYDVKVIVGGVRLQGVVVDYEERRQRRGYTDAPIVKFEHDGKKYRIPSQISSAWRGFQIGDEVTIFFDPEDEREIIINSFYHKYGEGGLYLLFGIFLLVAPSMLRALGEKIE